MNKLKDQKYKEIELSLLALFDLLNMDKPTNFDQIVDYIFNDMAESADGENWSDGDVVTGFRRWIEGQFRDNNNNNNYFQILNQGYNKDLEREEIQIHGGENANIFLIKTDEGFIVDVYGQNYIVDSMVIWEDDLNPDVEESTETPTKEEVKAFLKEWGQKQGEITANLGYPESHNESDELLMENYFFLEGKKQWYPKINRMYSAREQKIADYVRNNRDNY